MKYSAQVYESVLNVEAGLLSVKRRQGFTIVELLVVIVVIGVLAAITIVAYNGMQARAYNASLVN